MLLVHSYRHANWNPSSGFSRNLWYCCVENFPSFSCRQIEVLTSKNSTQLLLPGFSFCFNQHIKLQYFEVVVGNFSTYLTPSSFFHFMMQSITIQNMVAFGKKLRESQVQEWKGYTYMNKLSTSIISLVHLFII